MAEEIRLAPHDGLADFEDGLLALLDILHQLDGRGVALAHVVADFLGGAVVAIEHAAVLRVQAKLRHVLVVHLDDVIVAIFDEIDVRLHHPRAGARIAQAGPRIQVLDHLHGDLDVLERPPQHLGQFLVLPHLQQPQVVGDDLPGDAALAVHAFDFQQQALPQIARAHAGRIERLHHLQAPARHAPAVCSPSAAISSSDAER